MDGTRVVRTSNGWFAVLAGTTKSTTIGEVKAHLGTSIVLPDDSYLSSGEPFLETKWEAPKVPILARAEYNGTAPVRLSYQDLQVVLDGMRGSDGNKTPIASVHVHGVAVLEMRLDEAASPARVSSEVLIVRLDSQARLPQVVFSAYTGGAHCCTATKIATLFPDGSWHVINGETLDGDGGYALEDLDGDGTIELLSLDNTFLYAFASYAQSVAPPRIHRLVDSELRDVTQDPRYQIYLRQNLKEIESWAAKDPSLWHDNGFLAGWVAAKSQIGEFDDAWKRMLATYDHNDDFNPETCAIPVALEQCPANQRRKMPFPEALRAHLIKNNYLN